MVKGLLVRGVPSEARGRTVWTLVGGRIRSRRTHLGLAIDGVAEELGIEPNLFADYEAGAQEAPARLLAEIASLFGVPMLWFFQDVVGRKQEYRVAAVRRGSPPPNYRVATVDERIGFLAESFRKLDFEGQQHLLAIAAALSRPGEGKRTNRSAPTRLEASPESRPRRVQRMSNWQYSSRKSK